jgi:hypothetical protein
MSQLMYQASSRTFSHNLRNLSAILKIAARDAKARGIEPTVLMGARLAPDMLPLPAQVMIASDNAKGCCARLAGVDMPSYADDDDSFEKLQERIKKTLAFIRTVKPAQFEGSESREIVMETPIGKLCFNGADYLYGWALPNFYFHCSTAYDILRHNGVTLGKADFLGPVPGLTATGQAAKFLKLPAKKKPGAKAKTKTKTKARAKK